MSVSKHTPTPWNIEKVTYRYAVVDNAQGGEWKTIAETKTPEDSAYIVHCVNLFEELVEELSVIHSDMIPEGPDCEAWHRIKLLLKRARGESC